MSIKRVYYVKAARQTYAKDTSTSRTIEVTKKDGTPRMGRGGRPMTRRVTEPDHTRPNPLQKCSRCGITINVGDPYLYWEPYFRSSAKIVRCMKATCFPRPSERESSAMQSVLAAQESVEDSLADLSEAEDVTFFEDLRQEVVDALTEVIDQYREAAESFGQAGPSAERADELESGRDDIEYVSFEDAPERDGIEGCDKAGEEDGHDEGNLEGCNDCDARYDEALNTWREEQANTLRDAMGDIG